jgi:two-component system, NtrC family, response regulator PilR
MASILVVDDELSLREFLEILLRKQGHDVATAADVPAALRRVSEGGLDLVITDLRLGEGSGLTVLEEVRERSPGTEVVVVTAFATAETAIRAMKLGAYDYLLKPFKVDELRLVVEKALERRSLVQENRVLRHRVGAAPLGAPGLLGDGPAMAEVRALVEKVAPASSTVLVTGESGSGKEVVARSIHARGPRREQPFVAINCGAIPEGLIESELFGHERGSFTGAAERRAGLFEVAGSGTLFLDEVGELPPAIQVKLLRAVQERRVRRVGGTVDLPFSARIVAATNRDLQRDVAEGRFREDLYYRLNVIQLRVPPLREHREDVPLLVEHFLARFAFESGRAGVRLAPDAWQRLRDYDYPGNVRELANIVERAVTLADGPEIRAADLPPAVARTASAPAAEAAAPAVLPEGGIDLQEHLDAIERRLLDQALERSGGVKTVAARLLRITFRSLRYRLAKFGIGER